MGFKQHISRTLQMIEQQVNDVPFRPDDEADGQVKSRKPDDLHQMMKDEIIAYLISMGSLRQRLPIF